MVRGACLLAIVLSACASDTHYTTRLAPDFAPGRHTVSVFGVYKDGRMSPEAWTVFAPSSKDILGGVACEAAYGGTLLAHDPALSSAVDDYATANGPTDDLMAQLAPAAQGDLILVLTIAGQLPVPIKVSVHDPPRQIGAGGAYGLRGKKGAIDNNALQITATFFSVALRHSVAVIDLEYTGTLVDEALEKFDAQLAQFLSTNSCAGWRKDAVLHPDQIRRLGE
jgi:hypothetical protein